MTQEEREALEKEYSNLKERHEDQTFIDPKEIRRLKEITSLLMTNGENADINFKFVKGRKVSVGMNFQKPYNKGGGKIG